MTESGSGASAPWNHSIQYVPFVLSEAGRRPRAHAIDVGTGDGMLASRLARTIPHVVGLDRDDEQVLRAAERWSGTPGLEFRRGDLLEATPEPYDFVVASGVLHHVPLRPGLEALRSLTAPGGTLVVVGLALEADPLDWALSILSVPLNRVQRRRRGWYEHGAPREAPHETVRQSRDAARDLLPGARLRRRLYWRYTLVWDRPR